MLNAQWTQARINWHIGIVGNHSAESVGTIGTDCNRWNHWNHWNQIMDSQEKHYANACNCCCCYDRFRWTAGEAPGGENGELSLSLSSKELSIQVCCSGIHTDSVKQKHKKNPMDSIVGNGSSGTYTVNPYSCTTDRQIATGLKGTTKTNLFV